MTLEEGDVLLHKFSPTGFYSSAVRTPFLRNLEARSERQIPYSREQAGDHTHQLDVGVKGKNYWVTRGDLLRAREWFGQGFTAAGSMATAPARPVARSRARKARQPIQPSSSRAAAINSIGQ